MNQKPRTKKQTYKRGVKMSTKKKPRLKNPTKRNPGRQYCKESLLGVRKDQKGTFGRQLKGGREGDA